MLIERFERYKCRKYYTWIPFPSCAIRAELVRSPASNLPASCEKTRVASPRMRYVPRLKLLKCPRIQVERGCPMPSTLYNKKCFYRPKKCYSLSMNWTIQISFFFFFFFHITNPSPSMRSRQGWGQVDGIGRVSLLTATPYATAKASMPLYGVSPVRSSHSSTP